MAQHTVDVEGFESLRSAFLRIIFGDRIGVAIFLGALSFFTLYWRIGFFSTDSYAIANTMVAVSDGQLYIDRIVYGPESGVTPGMHDFDGRLYGRNYGVVFFAVPILYLLQIISLLMDLRLVLAGVWTLALLGSIAIVVDLTDRRDRVLWIGSAVLLVMFVAQAAAARPLDPYWIPLIALQLTTIIAAGLVAVFIYRLIASMYERRLAIAAGVGTFLATPVGFWASIPKRHSFTALFAILVLYSFYRSRTSDVPREATVFRALAYGATGLATWVHAAEGFVLLISLLLVDFLTLPRFRLRDIAVIAGVFLLSLLPFLVTNELIAGNPLRPPRLLSGYNGSEDVLLHEASASSGGDQAPLQQQQPDPGANTTTEAPQSPFQESSGMGGVSDRADSTPREPPSSETNAPPFRTILAFLGSLLSLSSQTATTMLSDFGDRVGLLAEYLHASVDSWFDPGILYHVFARSGYIEGLSSINDRAINLAVLESMPLFGVFLATPALVWRAFDNRRRISVQALDAARVTDLLAIVYLAVFVTLYLDRLPARHMFTVRYLHPIYPIGIYLLARIDAVRYVVRRRSSRLLRTYVIAVLAGIPLYIAALTVAEAVLSEAVQLYAIVASLVSVSVGIWMIETTIRGDSEGTGALVIGVAAASVTIYLLVSGLGLFAFTDDFVLPLSRSVAESIRFINPWRSLW